ncbi:opacity protein-like surface antigen [Streptomyces sp. V3I8]|uniref:hypothetical protein n=1 Tax=Streptomyces sp. V3I8 TaxID=3042279 RepID=UPI00278B4A97|nr:hypothetical protein [Streptomyces sp. V3I8]MDQ1037228.1 opacity protein-like surface antigen [Streptomyces sp. V3I8]
MIKKIACVSVMAVALLTAAPAAQAAAAAPPAPSAGAPGADLLNGLLGSLEIGNPARSPSTLLPTGILGG